MLSQDFLPLQYLEYLNLYIGFWSKVALSKFSDSAHQFDRAHVLCVQIMLTYMFLHIITIPSVPHLTSSINNIMSWRERREVDVRA
jgi:hypothetical protein